MENVEVVQKVVILLGQIAYALVPMIARGEMLGPEQPVILHMLDIQPADEILKGVKMELMDGAFPLLKGVITTTDVIEACKGVDIAIMLGGFPRTKGERKDLISKNVGIYKAQALALEQHADSNCKVLVVANPANTNALILKEFAPSIPEENITSLTRLDHNRALGQIADNLNVHVGDVKNVIIWGNHSSSQYPDANHATVDVGVGHKSVREILADDHWLKTDFITNVQQRGEAIIKARRLSSAFSAASAACDHMRDWVLGTPKSQGTWVSMGVYSDGSYGIQPGLIYSFPVTCEKGEWSIVQGLKIDEFAREKMDALANELVLVVANPANTNALILKEFAPSIPEENITSLTRLDHNRALGQIADNLNVHVGDVKNVIIWGNHSSSQYPDANHATVDVGVGHKSVREILADDNWLKTDFITNVQQRGEAIIKARRLSSAFSAASAACDHMRDWVLGTPKSQGTWVSMGVYSDGSYGIQPGLIYSFPVTCEKGEWSIVQGLKIDEFAREKMDALANELVEEKTLAYSLLH
ncbi:malate dehydrogenase, cytoplasmic [Artemisia annua]|uniref:malate dehydrogenase n=1 Tax=Artemisia annua TaxID=35608 RepID=A0A2U1KJH2_ARTAN|nr:malate dehydrogenase, cytoplasmic [Artemisia annua]